MYLKSVFPVTYVVYILHMNSFSSYLQKKIFLIFKFYVTYLKNVKFYVCAAKAFYSCPAINSRRPESQNTSKEPQLDPEEESRIIQARSHVTLVKSSKNYKPSEE